MRLRAPVLPLCLLSNTTKNPYSVAVLREAVFHLWTSFLVQPTGCKGGGVGARDWRLDAVSLYEKRKERYSRRVDSIFDTTYR